jgi:hypothetical protein
MDREKHIFFFSLRSLEVRCSAVLGNAVYCLLGTRSDFICDAADVGSLATTKILQIRTRSLPPSVEVSLVNCNHRIWNPFIADFANTRDSIRKASALECVFSLIFAPGKSEVRRRSFVLVAELS